MPFTTSFNANPKPISLLVAVADLRVRYIAALSGSGNGAAPTQQAQAEPCLLLACRCSGPTSPSRRDSPVIRDNATTTKIVYNYLNQLIL